MEMRAPELLLRAITRIKPELTREMLNHHLPRLTSPELKKLIDNPAVQEAMQKELQQQLDGYVEYVEMLNRDRNRKTASVLATLKDIAP